MKRRILEALKSIEIMSMANYEESLHLQM
jgi:hypothetical protein